MRSFRYDFTISELCYFLFSKKTCPNCGNKMKKNKGFEIVDGSMFNTNSVPLYITRGKVKHYYYLFNCPKCNSEYKLNQLVKKNNIFK